MSPAKRSGKRPAKKATKKAARKAAVVSIPSPVEVLGEVGANLDERERRFAYAYAADPNASKAYRVISPDVTDFTARSEGMRMKRRPDVAEFIAQLQSEMLAKFAVTNERIIEEYARIAFVDLAELYSPDGKLLPVHEMPEHARRAVAAIEVEELFDGTGKDKVQVGFTTKLKLNRKRDALQDLAKIRKMLVDRTEHDVSPRLAELMRAAEERLEQARG